MQISFQLLLKEGESRALALVMVVTAKKISPPIASMFFVKERSFFILES